MGSDTGAAGTNGYVHEPDSVTAETDAEAKDDAGEEPAATAEASTAAAAESTAGDTPSGFGRQGWVLVVAVIICFLIIPGIIYLRPTAPAELGWTFFMTFLVLPFIPAVGLGLIAVWSMTAAT